MNCAEWEERVALYAGGDLEPPAAASVEKHLRECPGCQMFASGIRQSLEGLRSAHEDVPAEAVFAAVRARVMERVAPRRRVVWAYGLGAAVAALLLVLAIGIPRDAVPPPPQALVRTPEPPAEAFVIPRPVPARVERTVIRRAAREQVLIKLVTNDPDVVIYWIAESKGD